MAFRVNSEGTRLDKNGNEMGKKGAFKAELDKAWKANNPGNTQGPSADKCITIVETGDCQWDIAEAMGADPVKTAYALNEQHKNPDLIHAGDVVFVDKTQVYAQDKHGDDNSDVFTDQYQAGAAAADSAGKASTKAGDAMWGTYSPENGLSGLLLDSYRYLQSVPEDQRDDVVSSAVAHGKSQESRQTLFESYLLTFENDEQRKAAADRLKADHFGDKDNPAKAEIDKALQTANDIHARDKAAA